MLNAFHLSSEFCIHIASKLIYYVYMFILAKLFLLFFPTMAGSLLSKYPKIAMNG